jgi:hypothetical protein
MSKEFSKKEVQKANKYMKECLTSLAIKEIWIKTTLKVHFFPDKMAIFKTKTTNPGKDEVKHEPFHTLLVKMQISTTTVDSNMKIP